MKYRTRIYYTEEQKSQMWDRWQRGESLKSIGRAFDRGSSSIYNVLSCSGGIRPPPRQRSRFAVPGEFVVTQSKDQFIRRKLDSLILPCYWIVGYKSNSSKCLEIIKKGGERVALSRLI